MREILFRAKRTDNDEWIEGDLLQYLGWGKVHIVQHYKGAGGQEVIPETVGQYTGINDMNNKRIFEGDVISIPYRDMSGFLEFQEALVFWDDERIAWCVKFMDGEILYLNDVIDPHNSIDFEIVSNIIDNKELAEAWE